MTRRTLVWATAALLGIVLSVTAAWSASLLAGQRIGLSSEPLAVATNNLAPKEPALAELQPSKRPKRLAPLVLGHHPTPTTSAQTPTVSSAPSLTTAPPPSRPSPPAAPGSGSGRSGSGAAAATTAVTTTSPGSPKRSPRSGAGDDSGGGSPKSSASGSHRDD